MNNLVDGKKAFVPDPTDQFLTQQLDAIIDSSFDGLWILPDGDMWCHGRRFAGAGGDREEGGLSA